VKAANGAAADKRLKRRSGVFVCDFEKAHVRKQSRPVPELPSSSFGLIWLFDFEKRKRKRKALSQLPAGALFIRLGQTAKFSSSQ
jgi:hypothetical protein